MSAYLLEFTLQGLPPMANQQLRGNWRVSYGKARQWKQKVFSVAWPLKPSEPLTSARVTITRCSSKCPDFDGLVSAGKPLIDGLVQAGVLSDDSMRVIGAPTYLHEPAAQRKGRIKIKVEAIAQTKEQG